MSGTAPPSFGDVQVTADHFNRYKEDLKFLKDFGANAYRFSFSWARVFPNCSGTPNEEALQYYSDMIDTIIANGAEPIGTVCHTLSGYAAAHSELTTDVALGLAPGML
jgi:beta-glucosidase/6-phospho-beta-glucosidase/beta-galactosidase